MYLTLLFVLAIAVYSCSKLWERFLITTHQSISHIPSFRYGSIPGFKSWIGTFRFMRDPAKFFQAGFEEHKDQQGSSSCFRFSDLYEEIVVICDKKKVEEYFTAPHSVLSGWERHKEDIQIKWTMGHAMFDNPYPIQVIRRIATSTISVFLEGGQEEVQATLRSQIGESNGK